MFSSVLLQLYSVMIMNCLIPTLLGWALHPPALHPPFGPMRPCAAPGTSSKFNTTQKDSNKKEQQGLPLPGMIFGHTLVSREETRRPDRAMPSVKRCVSSSECNALNSLG